MIVEELKLKPIIDFMERDLQWIGEICKSPEPYYSVKARNAAHLAKRNLLILFSIISQLENYVQSRDELFKEIFKTEVNSDPAQLDLFGGE